MRLRRAVQSTRHRSPADRSTRPRTQRSARRLARPPHADAAHDAAIAIARALTPASTTSPAPASSAATSISNAESPASRKSLTLRAPAAASGEYRRTRRSTSAPRRRRRRCSATMVRTMSSTSRDVPGTPARAAQILNQLLGRQTFGLGQRGAEDRRDDDFVGGAERAREVILEHAPARRGRSRLEHRPDPAGRVAGAQRRERFVNGRRMMREVVQHRDAARDADHFQAPLDALERPQPVGERRGARPRVVADGDGRQRVPHVVDTEQRRLEAPERRPAACTVKRVRPSPCSSRRARHVASSPRPKVSTGLTALRSRAPRHPELSAPSSSSPFRGTRLTSRRNASRTASRSA